MTAIKRRSRTQQFLGGGVFLVIFSQNIGALNISSSGESILYQSYPLNIALMHIRFSSVVHISQRALIVLPHFLSSWLGRIRKEKRLVKCSPRRGKYIGNFMFRDVKTSRVGTLNVWLGIKLPQRADFYPTGKQLFVWSHATRLAFLPCRLIFKNIWCVAFLTAFDSPFDLDPTYIPQYLHT